MATTEQQLAEALRALRNARYFLAGRPEHRSAQDVDFINRCAVADIDAALARIPGGNDYPVKMPEAPLGLAIGDMKETTFEFKCYGRDRDDNEVLDTPVLVKLTFRQHELACAFGSAVGCPFITGGHNQRCFASHPGQEPLDKVYCPYVSSFGIACGPKRPSRVDREY